MSAINTVPELLRAQALAHSRAAVCPLARAVGQLFGIRRPHRRVGRRAG